VGVGVRAAVGTKEGSVGCNGDDGGSGWLGRGTSTAGARIWPGRGRAERKTKVAGWGIWF